MPARSSSRAISRRPSLVALAAALALASGAAGCESGTGGRPVTFDMRVGAMSTGQGAFTTSSGWTVTLDDACVAVGPIYLHANPPHLAGASRARAGDRAGDAAARGGSVAGASRNLFTRAADWLVPAAHAHEGDQHFAGGEVRGEWVGQGVLAPFADPELHLSGINGLAGPFRSFTVVLDVPAGELALDSCLRGHHAYVAGSAALGDELVLFEGGLDIEAEGQKRRVEGLAGVGALDDGSVVNVRVDLAHWFDQADFSTLTETAPSGRRLITPATQVRSAWFIGARDAHSFTLEVATPAQEGSR